MSDLFLLCAVFGFILCSVRSVPQLNNNCTGVCPGLEESNENSTSGDSEDTATEYYNETLRFFTPCETPNNEVTYCMEISKCSVLDAVKLKKKYYPFVEASKCGPANENPTDFRVCCGRFNNFRNDSSPDVLQEEELLIDILPNQCSKQRHIMKGRVYGGIEASLGEYPWMARIIHKNQNGFKSYGCAGFLIHTKYVVTAAHCINSQFSKIRGPPYSVLLGEHNMTSKVDCSPGGTFCADPVQVSRINEVVVHPGYDRDSKHHHNDIALLFLNKAVKLTDFVQPICLQFNADYSHINKYYISGWGKTETAESSPVKLKVDVVPFDKDECSEKFKTNLGLIIDESQICAGGEKLKDSCNGDSGGPLMSYNGSHYLATGLVSYGVGCGTVGWPGVYTSIPHYIKWLRLNMLNINAKSPKIKKQRSKKKTS